MSDRPFASPLRALLIAENVWDSSVNRLNVKQEVVINRNILFTNLNQNEAQSVHPESTHKGVN